MPNPGAPRFAVVPHSVDTGEMVATTFSTFFDNLAALWPVAAVTQLPMLLVDRVPVMVPGSTLVALVLIFALTTVAAGLSTAALTWAVRRGLRGPAPGVGESLTHGLQACLATLPVALLLSCCLVASACALFVPWLGVFPGLAVVLPAAVEERLGAVAALRRSWQLTAGHRFAIFLTSLGVGLVNAIFAVTLIMAGRSLHPGHPVLALAANLLRFSLTGGLTATALVVVYDRLCGAGEAPARRST